jgi:two-component system phosphate regulon sensor histidine kinase PhoR
MKRTRLFWQIFSSCVLSALGLLLVVWLVGRSILQDSYRWQAAAAAVLIGGSWLLARRISRPLEIIATGAQRFFSGDLDHRLPLAGSQEIAACAEALNAMAAQLREQMETIAYQSTEQDAVLSSMVEGVLTLDNHGAILDVNPSGGRMFQLEAAKVRGRPIHEVARKAALLKLVDRVLASSLPVHEEIVIYDREKRFLSASGNVLRDAENRRIGVVIVLRDVTELRRLENVRREFVANASHELRTPLTAVKNCAENLLAGAPGDQEDTQRQLRTILEQVNRLAALIDDILSLASIEKQSQERSVVLQPGPLREVLAAAIESCAKKAKGKDMRLDLSCEQDLVAAINPPLLTQAVVNLIDNAINYSRSGSAVQVGAAREEGGAVIRVVDEGCGIEAKHLPRLFERFYRVDAARSRNLGGTGLGLAIVKHVALAHGGAVSVQSKVGSGSTFAIHLPAASP